MGESEENKKMNLKWTDQGLRETEEKGEIWKKNRNSIRDRDRDRMKKKRNDQTPSSCFTRLTYYHSSQLRECSKFQKTIYMTMLIINKTYNPYYQL